MGRLTTYNERTADKILDRISNGDLLTQICQEHGMPPRKTFYTWMRAQPTLRAAYARAREEWSEFYAEKIVKIAFDDKADIFIEDGKAQADHVRVQRDRLKIDTLKWLVGKYAPRTYGDKPDASPINNRMSFSFLPDEPERVTGFRRVIVDPKTGEEREC